MAEEDSQRRGSEGKERGMKIDDAWYKEQVSLHDRFQLCRGFGINVPFDRILAEISTRGRARKPLREWIADARVDPRYRARFIEGLSWCVENGNSLFAVKPFDMELAKSESWREVEVEIYSQKYLEALERIAKKRGDKAKERERKKSYAAAVQQLHSSCAAAGQQGESEDSSGLAGDWGSHRKEKNKNIPPKGGDILCADARGVEAPPLSAEEDRYAKRMGELFA
ncbi:MAG: hypothetical protein ACI4P6_03450 [Candidatus Spyradosoma sp.]